MKLLQPPLSGLAPGVSRCARASASGGRGLLGEIHALIKPMGAAARRPRVLRARDDDPGGGHRRPHHDGAARGTPPRRAGRAGPAGSSPSALMISAQALDLRASRSGWECSAGAGARARAQPNRLCRPGRPLPGGSRAARGARRVGRARARASGRAPDPAESRCCGFAGTLNLAAFQAESTGDAERSERPAVAGRRYRSPACSRFAFARQRPADLRDRLATLVGGAGAAALGLIALAALVPWQRLPLSALLVLPVGADLVIALLRHAQGGSTSGYGALVVLPVLFVGLVGMRRSHVAVMTAATTALFALSIVIAARPRIRSRAGAASCSGRRCRRAGPPGSPRTA